MRSRSKLLLTSLTAALLLSLAVAGASARWLGVSHQQFRVTYTPLEITTVLGTTRCNLTMEGSFHYGTFSKTAESLIALITRTSIANETCAGGRISINSEALPWHERYSGFTGTLPTITGVIFRNPSLKYEIESSGLRCTTTTTARAPLVTIAELRESGVITGLRSDETRRIPLRGSFLCEIAGEATFAGTGSVTHLGSTATLSIYLERGPEEEESPRGPTLSPSPVEFGTIEPSELARRTVTITAGTERLTVNSIRLSTGAYFATTDPNACIGRSLEARATCSFKVIFVAPEEARRSVEDTVTVETTTGTARDIVRGATS